MVGDLELFEKLWRSSGQGMRWCYDRLMDAQGLNVSGALRGAYRGTWDHITNSRQPLAALQEVLGT